MKNNYGITLIALVITIICLLILAAVSIATFTGNSSLFQRAKETDYANEFATVQDCVMLKINELYFDSYNETNKSVVELLFENSYISDDYILDVSKIYESTLQYGHGNASTGDYYTLNNEQLSYVTTDNETIVIRDLPNIGYLPVNIFFDVSSNMSEIKLETDRTFSFNLTIKNFTDNNTSTHDVEYEISLNDKDNSNFIPVINTINLSESTYNSTMQKRTNITHELTVDVSQKTNNGMTQDKLILNIDVIKPYAIHKQVEITLTHDTLIDSSSNNYTAKLMNGTQIIKDNSGNKALSFDGIDDYVEIPALNNNFNWKSGIDVEATVRYDEFKNNSSILLLSNGTDEDYFILQNTNRDGNLKFEAQSRGLAQLVKYYHTNKLQDNPLQLGQKTTINVDMSTQGSYYNSTLSANGFSNSERSISSVFYPIVNDSRQINYLGRNDWSGSEYFKGLIYYIKVSTGDGTTIFEYNLNK